MAKPVQTGTKKPYSSPQLTVYGNVHTLTQANRPVGHRDNRRRVTYTTA